VCDRSAPVSPTHYSSSLFTPPDSNLLDDAADDNFESDSSSADVQHAAQSANASHSGSAGTAVTGTTGRFLLHSVRNIQSAPGSPQGTFSIPLAMFPIISF